MSLLEQASLVLIPSGYKEDTVYSVIPSNGSGDLSFTRASNGTRINSDGLVEVCPWNLFTYSEQFQNANWTGGGNGKPTMTDNFAEAPNGTFTASKMEAVSDAYQLRQNNAIENTQMNLSVYLRTNTGTKTIQLFLNNGTTAFSNLTVTTTWQRFEISGTVTTLSGSGRNGLATLEALTSSEYILVWGAQISVGLTSKPYFPTTDRLNVPRLTYQNGGGGCPSLLLEKQSTNICLYSEQLDNAAWTTLGTVTITANNTTSPDGTLNADKITAAVSSFISQIISGVITTVYTWSCYIKNVDSVISSIRTRNALTVQDANINWSGATISSITNITGVLNYVDVGNGWYRIFTTYTSLEAAQRTRILTDTVSTTSLFIWGAQLETASYASSYIPTTSASATRIADACSKTGISSLIGQTEGVIFVDFDFANKADISGTVPILLRAGANQAYIYISGSIFQADLLNGAIQCSIVGAIGAVGRKKIAFAYKQNDFVLYMNGVQIGTDTSGTVGTMSALTVGSYDSPGYLLNSGINQAILFKTRLTNSELATLTTI